MKHITYCRICPATCGLVVDVEDNRVVHAIGDVDQPLTRGFSCPKGRHIGDFIAAPDRYQTSMRRAPDGRYEPIDAGTAVEEVATRLHEIATEHGPESVAFFTGTQSAFASLTAPFANAWWATMRSHKSFSTMTIDQSAMWVADARLGSWAGGRHRFEDSDVWLLAGSNPVVSLQGGDFTGFPIHDPLRRLMEAKQRGLRLVVVDPRRTEVAAHADIHLQLVPGTDAWLFAGLLHVILREGFEDRAFCEQWVNGLPEFRDALAAFTPEVVAGRCGVAVDDVVAAARLFGGGERGMALTGTGPDMGPWSNLAEHLARALNVVCGRYAREGDPLPGYNMLGSPKSPPAQAVSPNREWEQGYQSRFGYGQLKGQLPTASLPAEILQPGPDRVRALVVSGGNPAAAIPDQDQAIRALSALDLLVTIDPFPTETARLAHYVIAPMMHLERPDTTRGFEAMFEAPFSQYTPAIVDPPPGVIDDWQFFLRLAWARGSTLTVAGREYAPGATMPTTEEVLASFSTRGRISIDELKQHPHGVIIEGVEPSRAGPPRDGAGGRFELLAPDVATELAGVLASASTELDGTRPFRLIVRRSKETINSLGRRVPGLPKHPYNPCFAHPADLADLGMATGDLAVLASAHGEVRVVVESDDTLRRGVLSMTHGFGGMPGDDDDPHRYGTNPARLLSIDVETQAINRMPRMSAVPVALAVSTTGVPRGEPS
jgi:anaerobic selenocysteine-containing dehydrogenase